MTATTATLARPIIPPLSPLSSLLSPHRKLPRDSHFAAQSFSLSPKLTKMEKFVEPRENWRTISPDSSLPGAKRECFSIFQSPSRQCHSRFCTLESIIQVGQNAAEPGLLCVDRKGRPVTRTTYAMLTKYDGLFFVCPPAFSPPLS